VDDAPPRRSWLEAAGGCALAAERQAVRRLSADPTAAWTRCRPRVRHHCLPGRDGVGQAWDVRGSVWVLAPLAPTRTSATSPPAQPV